MESEGMEYVKEILHNGIIYGVLEDNSIINKENSEKVGFLNNDNEIEMYSNTDLFEITEKLIYNGIFDRTYYIDDLFIIAFDKGIILTRIESIDIDRKKIILTNDEVVKCFDCNTIKSNHDAKSWFEIINNTIRVKSGVHLTKAPNQPWEKI